MQSVILHFSESEEVIWRKARSIGIVDGNCTSDTGESFQFWLYEEYDMEYDQDEKLELEKLLGRKPISSFQLLARSQSANFALKKVIELFKLSPGIMDDDIDDLWDIYQLNGHSKNSVNPTIFNLSRNN